jgi:hypothetical protein
MKKEEKSIRMSWPNYAYIRDLIERQRELLHQGFQASLDFIPQQSIKDIRRGLVSARDTAHQLFQNKTRSLGICWRNYVLLPHRLTRIIQENQCENFGD